MSDRSSPPKPSSHRVSFKLPSPQHINAIEREVSQDVWAGDELTEVLGDQETPIDSPAPDDDVGADADSKTDEGGGGEACRGSGFKEEKRDSLLKQKITCENLRERVDEKTLHEFQVIFDCLDDDNSGSISIAEMESAFRTMGIRAKSSQIRALLHEIDEDDNGELDVDEFSVMLQRITMGEKLVRHEPPAIDSDYETPIDALKKVSKFEKFRMLIWNVVGDNGHSWLSRFVIIFVMSLIMVSCTTMIMETVPSYYKDPASMQNFAIIEEFCIYCFTVEFLLRFFSTPSYSEYVRDLLNAIDFIAILPFYIELALKGQDVPLGVLRTIRLIRVFRLFKFSRYMSWIGVFYVTIIESAVPLGVIVFVMLIYTVLAASLMYMFEKGDWNKEVGHNILPDQGGVVSPFESIPHSMWWCLITMTTVGYGMPHVPATIPGRFLAAVTGICGILILAVPISVISANFQTEYARTSKVKDLQRDQAQKFSQARQMALKRHKELASNDTSGSVIAGQIDDGELYLMSTFELTKSNQKKLLGRMKDKENSDRVELLNHLVDIVNGYTDDGSTQAHLHKQASMKLGLKMSSKKLKEPRRGSREKVLAAMGRDAPTTNRDP